MRKTSLEFDEALFQRVSAVLGTRGLKATVRRAFEHVLASDARRREPDGRGGPGWGPERLASAGIALTVRDCHTRAELAEHAGDADMVWLFGGRLTAEDLEVLPRCGAIIRAGSGVDNVPVSAAT